VRPLEVRAKNFKTFSRIRGNEKRGFWDPEMLKGNEASARCILDMVPGRQET